MKKVLCGMICALAVTGGCTLAEVKVDVVSERTSLENQVLGTYNALDSEMLQVASVRGVDPSGEVRTPPAKSQEARDVVLSMQTLSFHDDDLQRFKRLGWVGEGADGLIEPFERTGNVPEELAPFVARFTDEEFRAVVKAVNEARMAVMRRVVALNEDLDDGDLPEVQQVFGRLNSDGAKSGERIQRADGTWEIRR